MKHSDSRDRLTSSDQERSDRLPAICNLPIRRNPNFTGRGEVLSALADNFFSDREQVFVQAIKGMGGIGKTQIALEYAYRFSSRYEAIWWVRAEDEMILAEDYALFAKAANLPERDAKNETAIIHAVRRWLEENRNWLVVFSNAQHPDQLSEYFPKNDTGHVLITSRHQRWEKRCPSFSILFFSRKESIEFLLQRTNRKDATGAESVSKRLVDFPLALELAAATITETNIGFSDYLTSFQTHHQVLWENRKPPLTYPDTLGTAVGLACEEIERETPAAIPLLCLFSYLGDDGILPSMVNEAKAFLPEQNSFRLSDDENLDPILSLLVRYSLVNAANGAISFNRLVQAALQDRIQTTEQKQWAAVAVSTISGIFPSENFRDASFWPTCVALLPHGPAVIQHALEHQAALPAAADLLDRLGSYLHARSFFPKAERFFRQALDIFEKEMGSSHPHVGAVANNLAALYQDQGRFEASETLFRRSREIYREALGEDHLYIGAITNNLASLLRNKGNEVEAESLFRTSLDIFQTNLGENHPQVATSLNNLAVILQDQGKYGEVENLLRGALDIYEAKLEKEHPSVAICLSNLALFFQDQGMMDQSEPLLRKALSIRETQKPANPRDIADSTMILAGVLSQKGEHAEAEALYRRVIDSSEKQEGKDLLQGASCAIHLAILLQDQGNHGEAEALFRKGVQLREARLPANHPDLAAGLSRLAGVLHEQRSLTKAESLYRRALEIYEAQPGAPHPDTAVGLNNLGILLYEKGENDEAERFFRRALEHYDAVLGPDHPDTAACRYNLSEFLKGMDKREEAEALSNHLPGYFTKNAF